MSFFDPSKEESMDFEPLAKGVYKLTCINVDHGPNKQGTGTLLKVEYSVEGQGERKLFDNFNLEHTNPKAAKIGRAQLKTLCEKANIQKLGAPHDLIGAQVMAEVSHREYNGSTYADVKKYLSNDVKPGVSKVEQQAPVAPAKAFGTDDVPF